MNEKRALKGKKVRWPCNPAIETNSNSKIKLKEHLKNTEKYPKVERQKKV